MIASHVNGFPPDQGHQCHPIRAFAISTGYPTWLPGDWDAGRDECASNDVIQGVISGWVYRRLLTDKAMDPVNVNQCPTVTLV